MGKNYAIETTYGIKYNTVEPVPIHEIVESLQAIERMLKRTAPFIKAAYGTGEIIGIDVYATSVEAGSLSENFMVRYVFGDKKAKKVEKMYKEIMKDQPGLVKVVALSAAALTGAGIYAAMGPGAPSTHIENYGGIVITAGADLNISKDVMDNIIKSVRDKKTMAKDAVKIILPAKSEDASISIEGMEGLDFSSDFVKESPAMYDPPVQEDEVKSYKNAEMLIYASDRDKTATGWAGLVVGITDKRLPVVLDESIDPTKWHGKLRVNADIRVISKYDKTKKRHTPRKIEVSAISAR